MLQYRTEKNKQKQMCKINAPPTKVARRHKRRSEDLRLNGRENHPCLMRKENVWKAGKRWSLINVDHWGRRQVIRQHNSAICQPTSVITGNESRWNPKWAALRPAELDRKPLARARRATGRWRDSVTNSWTVMKRMFHQTLLSFWFLDFDLAQMRPSLKSWMKGCEYKRSWLQM